ncbi:MAG: pur operon repressor [Eubacteriales bacterium]|nr:pur operon repressor [Eubacteriales bacterium]MDD3881501.1 pur operon repressor [Eubacteriales bacterium]MDD4513017.1 pur operon repressor [Eubacteriales bacterium]
MDKVRRNERLAAMSKILTDSPNRIYTLSYFCDMFGAAKSTMSEDVDILKDVVSAYALGDMQTVTGAAGGVRYRPIVPMAEAYKFVDSLAQKLAVPQRVLPGGFLYLSDILSQPELVGIMGRILAGQYYKTEPDFVLTMETKGIPVAYETAKALSVPLVIARRSSKVYEGPAVNINYVSGSSGRIETMSLPRRAVTEGQRALIVDDFMKGGGTAKGMVDLMREFAVTVVGMAFVMSTAQPVKKRVDNYKVLMVMDEVADEKADSVTIKPADWLTQE